MSSSEQLRAALAVEAEMQEAPAPDLERLISGGRARRRRRNATRIGAVVAAAVLVSGGAYGLVQVDSGTAHGPAQVPEPPEPAIDPLPLGIDGGQALRADVPYRLLAGVGATGASIMADLTLDGDGWTSGNFPVARWGSHYGGVAVYRPLALAAGTGCTDDTPSMDVGETPRALAQQLARLPHGTVIQGPTPRQAVGRDAVAYHVRLRIDDQCAAGTGYRVAETPRGSRGISYSGWNRPGEYEVIIDFWVMDVDGVPVVVDRWHQIGASGELVSNIFQTWNSIDFVIAD